MPSRIEDYALIGDCETAALVSRTGSIDWLCWPRFDSGACFAALLGGPEHGRWQVTAKDPNAKTRRRYREQTLILETDFETPEGAVTLVDFMPVRGHASDLARIIIGRRGRVEMSMELILRFHYGAFVPWVTRLNDGSLRAIAGPDMVVLHTDVPIQGKGLTTVADFAVCEGDFVPFVLTYSPSHLPPHEPVNPRKALNDTERFWREWSERGKYHGEWSEAVNRSLITLKALTYRPTGGMVAAPTTSLPEMLGGQRNWDYRFCWLRDATLTLLALMNGGYHEEAAAWRDWLLRAAAGSPSQVQIMYGLAGERMLHEREIDWLPGYENAQPVRVGNAAYNQLQLDVFGEVMDALYHALRAGLKRSAQSWGLQRALIKHLASIWQQPDQGLWEVRGGPQHFTYSKVMAWVAVDRTIKSAERARHDHFLDECRRLRQQIHDEVCEKGFDRQLGAFVQAYGSKLLDASALLIPFVGFLPADDPRVRGTVEQIEKRLLVDGLVLRYDSEKTDDGLPGGEGAFLACSFWLANNYVRMGRYAEARKMFEHLLSLRNDVGLLSEEYDPRAKRLVGNFPQAFSHVAIVDTAFNLEQSEVTARKAVQHRREPVER